MDAILQAFLLDESLGFKEGARPDHIASFAGKLESVAKPPKNVSSPVEPVSADTSAKANAMQ